MFGGVCAQKHIAAAAQDFQHARFSVDSEGLCATAVKAVTDDAHEPDGADEMVGVAVGNEKIGDVV